MTALDKQGHQADAVNGEHEENGDLDSGAAFIFLLDERALGKEWALIVHIIGCCDVCSLRLVLFCFRTGVFPQKTPRQIFEISGCIGASF